ncbi:hypothetical protein GQ651_03455 [Alphaproteobacteria bacterium GH1-50]|uniref:Chemotaxis protein methyltransferase n=1 Tax=Kangsaoukella pontilimi TaxID=2691042 RepID=A0A7C9MEA6_9RHOB|nr:protein-glutamate O-methyltransferase [Kangsaoukella pontilimi]MXQ06896.1 hypothetical protein [Kangsaoukella pontilimi]
MSIIAGIAREDAGLTLPDAKRLMVQSRLARRMRSVGCLSFDDYIALLTASPDAEERRALISVLTTNVTSFFREAHHFETLRTQVLPALLREAKRGRRLRFWSAGCSTGEEPYSLAMLLLALDPMASDYDIRILATDIDPKVLSKAKSARYEAASLSALPDFYEQALRATRQEDGSLVMPDSVRRLVTFRQLNLHAQWPMKGRFDAILCRNVLIYFDFEHQSALWPRFRASLGTEGWLFLGHSERIHPIETSGFIQTGVTTYRRTDARPVGTPERED